jgi:thiol-disulfide isomerase/thioredoxin
MRRVTILALLTLLLAAVPRPGRAEGPEPGAPEAAELPPMPEFRVAALDGRTLDSRDLRGQVVLLDLWATWCGPCLWAAPQLDRIYGDFKDRGVEMIGIAVDSGSAQEVAKAAKAYGMTYPVTLWSEELAEKIQNLRALPTYILIAPDWTVHRTWVGPVSPKVLRREIESLLGDEPEGEATR